MAIVVNGKKVAGVGLPGKSAYQAAVDGGFTGNEQEFNESLAKRNIAIRRNLLDNWYFVGGGSQQGGGQFPINQRGETSRSGSGGFIDRWKLSGEGTATLGSDGITLTATTGNLEFIQFLGIPNDRLLGETVCLSGLVDGDLLSMSTSAPEEKPSAWTNIINIIKPFGFVRFNYDNTADRFFCSAIVSAGNSVLLQASKLELGSTQTLAYQDEESNWKLFETPDYAGELARCQRYLLVLPGFNTLFSNIGVGSFFSETEAEITIPTPTTMRIMPTCAATGNWLLRGGGQLINVEAGASNFFVQQMSSNAVSMIINGLSGCPANQATQLLRSNNSTAKITLSAEL